MLRIVRRMASTRARVKPHYRLLGIAEDALPAEVRAAYLRKTMKTHPDVCKEPGAEHTFREVAHAYAILADPQKRKMYDSGASEEDISAESTRSRTKHRATTYEQWKVDILLYICRELGFHDPYGYAYRVQSQLAEALEAAHRTPRDFEPARKFGRENKGLLLGLTLSTVVTSGVPIVLLFTAKVVQHLDAHADDLLRPGGMQRWFVAYLWRPSRELLRTARKRLSVWLPFRG